MAEDTKTKQESEVPEPTKPMPAPKPEPVIPTCPICRKPAVHCTCGHEDLRK
jgi:hypothetical protein